MTDEMPDPDETQENAGEAALPSDSVADQYELNDVIDADYYATDDDDEQAQVTA